MGESWRKKGVKRLSPFSMDLVEEGRYDGLLSQRG